MKKIFLTAWFISSALLGSTNEFKPLQALASAIQEARNQEIAHRIIEAVQNNYTQQLKEIFKEPISNEVIAYFLNDIKYLKNVTIDQEKNLVVFIFVILSKAIYQEDKIRITMIYKNFPHFISKKVKFARQFFLRDPVASHRISNTVYLTSNTNALGYAIALGSERMVQFLIETCGATYNPAEHNQFLPCIQHPNQNLIQYPDTKKEVIAYLNKIN